MTKFEALDDLVFEITGESAARALSLIRQDINPHALAGEILEALNQEQNTGLSEHFNSSVADQEITEVIDEYIEEIHKTLATVDAALTDPERVRQQYDRWDELLPDSESERLRTGYDPGYYQAIRKNPVWVASSSDPQAQEAAKSFSETWRRVTAEDEDLRIVCEYGTFSLSETDAYQRAMLRVRHYVRNNQPYLSVGGIQINLRSGVVECMVSGCKHKGQLSTTRTGEDDREWMEYQILRILYHLGSHNKSSATTIYPKFTKEPNILRDSDEQKLISRARALASKQMGAALPVGVG